jgi:bifunctional N-acetylglucosamine-1-phosphate-uridyltransferase/glucosamine-1-phosphate-acetyltransferase GlmU-like protein
MYRDVPPDSLAFGRGRQVIKDGWAVRLSSLVGTGKNAR